MINANNIIIRFAKTLVAVIICIVLALVTYKITGNGTDTAAFWFANFFIQVTVLGFFGLTKNR